MPAFASLLLTDHQNQFGHGVWRQTLHEFHFMISRQSYFARRIFCKWIKNSCERLKLLTSRIFLLFHIVLARTTDFPQHAATKFAMVHQSDSETSLFSEELYNKKNFVHFGGKGIRRRNEDVDYWRKRSGWFDDDETMRSYNNGVYDTYYLDGDKSSHRSSGKGGGFMSSSSSMAKTAIKVLAVLVALGLAILLYRTLTRKSDEKEESDKKKKRSDSRTRSSSKSRSRSRVKNENGDYEKMDDEEKSARSKRSSRSRSKSKRSRSRSRARSRSRSHKEKAEPVLV